MTQQERIIQVLKERKHVSNFELHDLKPLIYQIPTRILELKAKGYWIESYHDREYHTKILKIETPAINPKRYWYVYKEELNRLVKNIETENSEKPWPRLVRDSLVNSSEQAGHMASTNLTQAELFNFKSDPLGRKIAV